MRGTNENLEAKAELAFEGAGGGYEFRKNDGWLGENVLSMDEVLFDPPLQVVGGGFEGDEDGSDNNGSKPTGTRFSN
jgi:hypothetical protein